MSIIFIRTLAIAAALPVLFVSSLLLAAAPKYTDPAQVDADFAYQGEYSGKVGDEELRLGVQVIAEGKGRFQAVAYVGGLPGDGWNKEAPVRAAGELKDGQVRFGAEHGSAVLKDGSFTVFDADGNRIGQLAKSRDPARRLEKSHPRAQSSCSTGQRPVWTIGRAVG
jgi:hypothetical protein